MIGVAPHPVILFTLILGRCRPVPIHVKRLHIEVVIDLGLLTDLGHIQRVPAHAGRHALRFDQVNHLCDGIDRASLHHEVVGVTAMRVDERGTHVDLLLDRFGRLGFVGGDRDADHGLDLGVVRFVVLRDHTPTLRIELDGIDATGLGQFQRFNDLGFRVVGSKEFGRVGQVTTVSPTADQIAADHQTTDGHIPDLAAGQAPCRNIGFGCRRRGRLS